MGSGVSELLSAASTKAEDKSPDNLLTVWVLTSYINISFSPCTLSSGLQFQNDLVFT